MALDRNSMLGWSLALAPVALLIPAIVLAGLGPHTFSHPLALVVALLLFIGLEAAALLLFVKAARSGALASSIIGMGLALILLVMNLTFEYYMAAEYLEELRLGLR